MNITIRITNAMMNIIHEPNIINCYVPEDYLGGQRKNKTIII